MSLGDQPALTRRELREREQLRNERPSSLPKRSLIAPKGRGRMSRSTRRAVSKSLQPTGGPRRRSIASRLISVVALLFAGTLVVAVSVPSNLFMSSSSAVADVAPVAAVGSQSLKVSADAKDDAPVRDIPEAISYAQALALKYAGVDYSYAVTTGAVRWPFPYAVPITDGFGPRDGGFHKGVDFVPGAGTPIYAIADGVATTATFDNSGYGQHVVLQHNLGGVDVESLYGHMIEGSSPIVVGQQVKVGDFLGLVGDTGIAYGAHLHFEIHIDKVPVDPFAWLQANAVN
ncbi:MAG: M23 family metallopeptidase [Actinobacteria bacterium]|nr:M23 family metallopeptidase [Actinomycetota bacterium]